jgi:magnesium transporter
MPLIIPRSRRQLSIVLATRLVSFAPLSRAAALALADLGLAAFFVSGAAYAAIGPVAPWFVLAAVLLGIVARSLDIESWALFIPRGLVGRVHEAFGARTASMASAALLLERIFLAGLACLVAGTYTTTFLVAVLGVGSAEAFRDLSTLVGVLLLGALWIRARHGYPVRSALVGRRVWIGVGVLGVTVVWGVATAIARSRWPLIPVPHPSQTFAMFAVEGWRQQLAGVAAIIGMGFVSLGHALPAVGSVESLTRAAAELPPPRIQSLRRIALVARAHALLIVAVVSFVFVMLVPDAMNSGWIDAPLLGLTAHLGGPGWLRFLVTTAVAVMTVIMLAHAADLALTDARNTLLRVAEERRLPERLLAAHPRFGTLANLIDAVAAVTAGVVLASGGGVIWIAHAYAVGLIATMVLKGAALMKLRRGHRDAPYRVRPTWTVRGREWPVGLALPTVVVAAAGVALLLSGEPAAVAASTTLVALAVVFAVSPQRAAPALAPEDLDTEQLLPSTQLSLDQLVPKPGTVLVPVRNPHSLGHVVAALQTSRDRDVVVMTVRMLGPDSEDTRAEDTSATPSERAIFSRVAAIAERYQRPVRLLIVPARNVFDAIVHTVLHLQASEIYVGESVTLSATAQARLLGEAWERAEKSEGHEVHLVIHHNTGRSDTYHIGAHAPSLNSRDLDMIHRLWLDAIKSVGPQVHHHDIVRAALIQMATQLEGPNREDALRAIQLAAKPADELAEVVRARDYSRLRDMVRNQPPSDLAALLTDLGLDEQVVVFRLLPRKDAAATFEYLSTDAREQLLRAMAKEDVAALLNDMAPDDRTMFLEELPAAATRELLSLLSHEERAVALTLLGYPEGSIGRLMTPHYVSVREDWTVQQVLDHVRTHGSDSETLNVIYVTDERGLLIDDIRIREFLLTSTTNRVSDLMDRRFVALKATDDQQTAVAAFKQYDRSALPVTDSAGMLIGIVTVDDVLDVVEATATKDIQRIGGVEALDEPYMQIAFLRMVQKRAGWLTALFIGEMLTATAMGVFENEIQKAVVLALFVPLIISSGGNSGSQASTLVIRALALGEVTLLDWWRVMRREIAAGVALGSILGLIGFLRISVWSAFSPIYGEHWLLVAFTVAFSLIGIVLWGTLTGSMLPFVLRRLGFDPATSSAPFVATLVDVTGLVIYFSVALIVLRGTLL